jgi:glycosyltransferase involved in cell wall biosynthesis/SAM-dependent methyltransferase
MARYLYLVPGIGRAGFVETDALSTATERHAVRLEVSQLREQASEANGVAFPEGIEGVVLQPITGILGRGELRTAARVLARGLPLWAFWPSEQMVERIDDERLSSLRRHGVAQAALKKVAVVSRPFDALRRLPTALGWAYRARFKVRPREVVDSINGRFEVAHPVSFTGDRWRGAGMSGGGIYFRADYWNHITSGGSYGHTCYVAKELRDSSTELVCLLAQRYPLLDDLKVRQIVMDRPGGGDGEDAIVEATHHYYPILKAACQLMRPAYVYERLVLGNYTAAMVSRDLQIPYIVEYNGSEISIQKSFANDSPFRHRAIFLEAEALAFRQATCISVVSQLIKDDLIARGVDAAKILVNPNGADLDSYAPASPEERAAIRREIGFSDAHRVIGFTATFGGWHATDVLAAAIPRICAASDDNRLLIIGDGVFRNLVDQVVAEHGLDQRVRFAGQVPQSIGARLLKACDVYVAPHNTHMVDGRFFGSPTKVFEYMALGGGVVASDLEQIGEVLSPALRVADLRRPDVTVGQERAVLCPPGDIDDFSEAVIRLADRPDLRRALGRNARQAVADHYSWQRHVERLWRFAQDLGSRSFDAIETGSAQKDEVQRQWNNSPVGSERARRSQPHTLAWFKELEADRYGTYAPWMPEMMEFGQHANQDVLEIGGGLGIDLAQFASAGARVTDVDLSAGHLALAEEHFRLRGLTGRFIHHDGEELPFADGTFDLVYSNGVIHHTPNTHRMVAEIHRVLRPGGRVIVMVYAENSLYYWRNLLFVRGVKEQQLRRSSMGDILSRSVEASGTDARPLVKVYTRKRLMRLFSRFSDIHISKRQLRAVEVPRPLRPLRRAIERAAGWNLILKAVKPLR